MHGKGSRCVCYCSSIQNAALFPPLIHNNNQTPQDTIVAIRAAGDRLVVANLDGAQFPEADFSTDPDQV
jgi:hypothetical protein